ncbi:hypothetical protein V1460_24650 [Streptomyces sp. SCSIO 30461]|uniref:hypothetical protein n=1 Tax=Streptomyces sp. SCSIO 30461 TaxID=3118085 RepID=UPI0030CE0E55
MAGLGYPGEVTDRFRLADGPYVGRLRQVGAAARSMRDTPSVPSVPPVPQPTARKAHPIGAPAAGEPSAR